MKPLLLYVLLIPTGAIILLIFGLFQHVAIPPVGNEYHYTQLFESGYTKAAVIVFFCCRFAHWLLLTSQSLASRLLHFVCYAIHLCYRRNCIYGQPQSYSCRTYHAVYNGFAIGNWSVYRNIYLQEESGQEKGKCNACDCKTY